MARKDKLLDVLAMARLPESVKIARLAHKWIGKPFPVEQAKAIIKCYFTDVNGRLPELTRRLYTEKHRQERLRNDRAAFAEAALERAKSPMLKYQRNPTLQQQRTMEIAQQTFGAHVRDNFNADTLALMSLISGENRWYRVNWLNAGFKPLRSAVIEVVTLSTANAPLYRRFLLYRTNGRVLVARTVGRTLAEAWGGQLPEQFMEGVAQYKAEGCSFQMDYESQEMVVTGPSGVVNRVPWSGQTVDE